MLGFIQISSGSRGYWATMAQPRPRQCLGENTNTSHFADPLPGKHSPRVSRTIARLRELCSAGLHTIACLSCRDLKVKERVLF